MSALLRGKIGEWLLQRLTLRFGRERWDPQDAGDPAGWGVSRLERMFGGNVADVVRGKTVLDYGSGRGADAVAAVKLGATQAYGLEVRSKDVATATEFAARSGVSDRCAFIDPIGEAGSVAALRGAVDVVFSIDAFEHYARPEAVLADIFHLLRPGGVLLIWFGPPWKHPLGAHLGYFNRLPWLHFLFAEDVILAVRARYVSDGATRLEDTGDGLNRMTIERFERMVATSGFALRSLQLHPIKKLAALTKLAVTREYFTSCVQAELVKPLAAITIPEPDRASTQVA